MPAASNREFRARVGLWKDWPVRLAREKPDNRVLFSCRTLDDSAPLSTPTLRAPQVQIEALSDDQVHQFLQMDAARFRQTADIAHQHGIIHDLPGAGAYTTDLARAARASTPGDTTGASYTPETVTLGVGGE